MKKRPLILITNDDGISAKGITALTKAMQPIGDCFVLAPDAPQSGQSHSITVLQPIYLTEISETEDLKRFSCSGTPVDCVKLAVLELMPQKPDLIVSGFNHGSNASINVTYSGTMAAAIEGAMLGIPSIGFSVCDFSHDAVFSHAISFAREIAKDVIENGLPEATCLNVNFPKINNKPLKGIKLSSQGHGGWVEGFEQRKDPRGRNYYWISGNFKNGSTVEGEDLYALENNYVSVQPVSFDFTDNKALELLKERY